VGGRKIEVVESGPLSASWSAQACELYALWRASELLKDKVGTIYTDSKYAYSIVHTFGKIWKERGLMNTHGKELIHQGLIVRILDSLKGPKKIAVTHIRGHQQGTSYRVRGNNLADEEAKEAAMRTQPSPVLTLQLQEEETLKEKRFAAQELENIKKLGAEFKNSKWVLPDGREILPKSYARKIIDQLHERTHWRTKALSDHFLKHFACIGIYEVAKQATYGYLTCQKVNKRAVRQTPGGRRQTAYRPFEKIQVDFTELPKVGRWRYLLVIIDQLTHWVKAFPTARATASSVAEILLEHIITRYGIARVIDSNQSLHFTSKKRVVKVLTTALGITWEYHTPWHPQSSGRVE